MRRRSPGTMLINDLNPKLQRYRGAISAAVEEVLNSGYVILGPKVKRFEHDFASYLGAGHCVSVANGTDAIELALKSFGVGRGDSVATVANAGMYTTTALLSIGAAPFFMDVDLETRTCPYSEVARALDAGVKAVVVTHLYGTAAPDIERIASLCSSRGVRLLEDCAQAHGARVSGRSAGTFGDAASFSFYPTKNLGALGDGGAVVTNDGDIADAVRSLRQYGWSSKYRVERGHARNSRLDEFQAAILSVFLPDLDSMNIRRREIASLYGSSIKHPGIVPPSGAGEGYVAHLYVVRVKGDREGLRAHLQKDGIATDIHYPIPDHWQPVFEGRFKDVVLPNTELLCGDVMTLPCYPEMSDADVEEVISKVNSW